MHRMLLGDLLQYMHMLGAPLLSCSLSLCLQAMSSMLVCFVTYIIHAEHTVLGFYAGSSCESASATKHILFRIEWCYKYIYLEITMFL
ncbi:hypothetical protein GDO78_008855 [Eleutherodactylus coqui]|uniref:Uncharacterized protein n=1 Tax=Eleutherodactylus coqui TaxID=57060 RepID=A0A8J6FE63_ELECQ|nr:hypothetical protein GDO78_008855 [Eleutherodactylus coqui]